MLFHQAVIDEILEERVSSSRGRRNARGVKRKMSSFPIKARLHKPSPARIDLIAVLEIIMAQ